MLNSDARVFEIARTLIKRHESVAVVLTHESIDTAKLPSSKLLYACARFILLPALMEYYRKPVIVLDLDALVMRDLGALLRTASHASVAVPLVNQGRGEPTETLWAALVCFSTQPAAHTLAALAANYILEEIACGRGYWFLDQAALLAVLAHANALPETEVLLLPEHVLQCTDRPEARLVTDADDLSSCFWTVAASVPAHAGRIEHPAFRAYCD